VRDWLTKKTIRDVYRPTLNRLRSSLIFQTNTDYKNSVLLSSGGRTGSTWVAETLTKGSRYRYLYEPFSLYRVLVTPYYQALLPGKDDGVAVYDPLHYWQDRPPIDNRLQYIRPNTSDVDLFSRAESVLTGRFHHPEVDQYNYTPKVFFAKRFIKEVKSNLWLAWLHKQFPELKIILLIRHPIPTIQSRLAGKSAVATAENRRYFRKLVLGQPQLVEDFLKPYISVLEAAETMFQQRLAVWCIQNLVPLSQLRQSDVRVVFYENFCVNPAVEISKLHAFLGRPSDERTIRKMLRNMQKPSATHHAEGVESKSIEGLQQVSTWMKRTSKDHLEQTDDMLRAFGLNRLYSSSSPLPNEADLVNHMK